MLNAQELHKRIADLERENAKMKADPNPNATAQGQRFINDFVYNVHQLMNALNVKPANTAHADQLVNAINFLRDHLTSQVAVFHRNDIGVRKSAIILTPTRK